MAGVGNLVLTNRKLEHKWFERGEIPRSDAKTVELLGSGQELKTQKTTILKA